MKEHLRFFGADKVKEIAVFMIVMLDITLLPVLILSYRPIDSLITVPLLILTHLWFLRMIIVEPFKLQLETMLYLGVLGAVGTISHYIALLKIIYSLSNESTLTLLATATFITAGSLYVMSSHQIKKYRKLDYERDEDKQWYNKKIFYPFLYGSPVLGYLIVQTNNNAQQHVMFIPILLSLSGILVMIYFASRFLHKYMFMKKNPHLLRYHRPIGKEKKKYMNKKGFEIK